MEESIENMVRRLERSGFTVNRSSPKSHDLRECKLTVDLIGRVVVIEVSKTGFSIAQTCLRGAYSHICFGEHSFLVFVIQESFNKHYSRTYVNNLHGHFLAINGDRFTMGTQVDGRNFGIRYLT